MIFAVVNTYNLNTKDYNYNINSLTFLIDGIAQSPPRCTDAVHVKSSLSFSLTSSCKRSSYQRAVGATCLDVEGKKMLKSLTLALFVRRCILHVIMFTIDRGKNHAALALDDSENNVLMRLAK